MDAKIYIQADDTAGDRRRLADLLDQTIDAMPGDTDPGEYDAVLWVLIAQTLASATRQGLLPVREQAETLTRCRQVLHGLARTGGLPAFQAAAKASLRDAICGE